MRVKKFSDKLWNLLTVQIEFNNFSGSLILFIKPKYVIDPAINLTGTLYN